MIDPKDDPVNSQMIEAGVRVLSRSGLADDYLGADKLLLADIYRAMFAASQLTCLGSSELLSLAEVAGRHTEDFILSEIANPRWRGHGRFDWKSFVPSLLVAKWDTLSTESRLIVFIMASEAADIASP